MLSSLNVLNAQRTMFMFAEKKMCLRQSQFRSPTNILEDMDIVKYLKNKTSALSEILLHCTRKKR